MFNPLAGRYGDIKIEKSHEKKKSYNERVLQIENGGSFALKLCVIICIRGSRAVITTKDPQMNGIKIAEATCNATN